MQKKKALFLIFLTAIISGISIFINKYSVSKIEPYTFTFLKNLLVTIFLISIILLSKEYKALSKLNRKQWLCLLIIGLIGGSIPFLLFFKGLSIASAASSGFIHKTLFIFASLFALLLLKEKLSTKILFPTILLLIGNYLILRINNFSFGKGELLILIATVLWAIENVFSKYTLKKISGNIVAFGRMFFGSIFILIFLLFNQQLHLLNQLTKNDFIWIILSSILLLLFVITYYNGLKFVKVSVATSILLLGSPITTFLSYLFSDYQITLSEIIGSLFIISGLILTIKVIELSEMKVKSSPQHIHNEL